MEFDRNGVLHIADTSRGAIWKVVIGPDGKGGKPALLAQSPLLEGADGLAFDRDGNLWVTANERNALVTVTADGTVREVVKNGSRGPLEFPAAIVFIGDTAYIANFDAAPRQDGCYWQDRHRRYRRVNRSHHTVVARGVVVRRGRRQRIFCDETAGWRGRTSSTESTGQVFSRSDNFRSRRVRRLPGACWSGRRRVRRNGGWSETSPRR